MDYNTQPEQIDQKAAYDGDVDDRKRKRILMLLLLLLFFLLFIIFILYILRYYIEKKSTTVSVPQSKIIETGTIPTSGMNPVDHTQQDSLWKRILDQKNDVVQEISPTTVVQQDNVFVAFNYSNEVNAGDTFIVPVMLNPGNKKITSIELHLKHSDNIVIQKAVNGGALPTVLSAAQINNGTIRMILGGTPSQLLDASKPLVNLTIQAKSKGSATISSSEATKITALTYRDYLPVDIGQISINIK